MPPATSRYVHCQRAPEDPRILRGGSMWESNPPRTVMPPATGFEVQETHQDLAAPVSRRDAAKTIIARLRQSCRWLSVPDRLEN